MHSFYFGTSLNPLYGVIHQPSGKQFRNSAILICNSVGHEYIRCHRELKRLADKLSGLGYFVLRFDYTGVGDSAGNLEDFDFSCGLRDINAAYDELKAISGQHQISCIGIRLGATLAFSAAQNGIFSKLVLWDPVLDGRVDYYEPLNKLQNELLKSDMWFSTPRERANLPKNELLSFQYSDGFIEELKTKKICEESLFEDTQYTYLHTEKTFLANTFTNKLLSKNQNKAFFIKDFGNWNDLCFVDSALISQHISLRIARGFQ